MFPYFSMLLLNLFFYACYHQWQHFKIIRWKKRWNLNQHLSAFHSLFSSVDGFKISRKARVMGDAFEFVYGEIDFISFIALLMLVKPDSETIFYDLGSGVGKPVMACAMVFPVKKSCGIELFLSLHECAIATENRFKKMHSYQAQAKKIQFIHGDFLTINFEDATLIFINATGFFGPMWRLLNQRINLAKNCQTVISISKPLLNDNFIIIRKTAIHMSWGIATAYIQQRK